MLGMQVLIGEILSCEREVGNIDDTFVVPIKKYSELLVIPQEKFQLYAQFL